MASVGAKWIILMTVVAVVAIGVAAVSWTGMFSQSERKVERISFISCEWSDDLTQVSLVIASTGADELVIDQVQINGTLVDFLKWEIFPSMRLKPGDQGTLLIKTSPFIFTDGEYYQFTIITRAGNSFSHTALAESDGFTFMKTEAVEVLDYSWDTTNRAYIDLRIKNTGTGTTTISEIRANNIATSLNGTMIDRTLEPGNVVWVRVTYAFTAGTRYEFTMVAASGTRFPSFIVTCP